MNLRHGSLGVFLATLVGAVAMLRPQAKVSSVPAESPEISSNDFAGTWDAVLDPMIRDESWRAPQVEERYDAALGQMKISLDTLYFQEQLYALATDKIARDPSEAGRTAARTEAAAARARADELRNQLNGIRQTVITARTVRNEAEGRPAPEIAGFEGIPVQRNTILVLFRDGTPEAAVSEFLNQFELIKRAEMESPPLIVVESRPDQVLNDEMEAARLLSLTDQMKSRQDIVVTAVQNTFLGLHIVPKPSRPNTGLVWDWHSAGSEGVLPYQKMFFPQAWNLSAAIRGRTKVGILDHGFDFNEQHDDLTITRHAHADCIQRFDAHGNAMAGIIGAKFGNEVGIDGASPFVDLVVCAPRTGPIPPITATNPDERRFQRRVNSFSSYVQGLKLLLDARLPVINVSLGYNWFVTRKRPDDEPLIRQLVAAQGTIVRAMLRAHAAHTQTIIVSAAGNDCIDQPQPCDLKAQWSSPINWAGLNTDGGTSDPPVNNVIVVEAAALDGTRLPLSDAGGTIAAIGEKVGTTFTGRSGYGLCPDGTSCAAPSVTATISMMLAYNSALTVDQIKQNLGITATGAVALLNAFTALAASSPNAPTDLANLDGQPGVTMSDFAMFKAAFKQVTSMNFVDDLNGDGTPNQNDIRFCRADLNGDGEISATRKNTVPNVGDVTDLGVMIHAWTDSVDPSTLPALLLQ
jgi:hypothetical protein